jgi:hypothetical protein
MSDGADWLDDQLLQMDGKSARNWRRASVGGLSVGACMAAIPNYGLTQIRIPIEGFRQFKMFCMTEKIPMHRFVHDSVLAMLEIHPRAKPEMIEAMRYDR